MKAFKDIDLREQLTEELKSKWYYKERKWGLRINKHSVVFDDDFGFKLIYHPESRDIYVDEKTGESEELVFDEYVTIREYNPKSGEEYESNWYEGEYFAEWFAGDDKYSDDINEALEYILLYIANYI